MPAFPKPYRPNTFRHPLDASQVQSLNDNDNDIYRHLRYLRAAVDALEAASSSGTFPPTPHNLLGSKHNDTSAKTPPDDNDLIVGSGGLWEALVGGATDDVLSIVAGVVAWRALEDSGHWEPMTNGDPDNPEMLFDGDGDIIMVWVPA